MIISLVSQKGGVGKSTLAISIAWELHARGSRVLIVDTDPQGTSRMAGELAAERRLSGPTTIVLGKGFEQPNQLPRIAASFDHVVIDTPGHLSEMTKALLETSDVMLIPVGQSITDIWGNRDIITIVTTAKRTVCPDLRAAVVLVQTHPKTLLCQKARKVLESQALPKLQAETTDRVAWQEAMMAGQGIAQYAPKDKAAAELRRLVDEVLAFATGTMQEVANGQTGS
jgi:chromosome partitioning protein